jgi:hypothetical protein
LRFRINYFRDVTGLSERHHIQEKITIIIFINKKQIGL